MQTSSGSEHSCRRRVLEDPRINSHSPKFTRGGFKRTGKVKDELLTENHRGRLSERGAVAARDVDADGRDCVGRRGCAVE